MAFITITKNVDQINTVKNTFHSIVINYPNDTFNIIEEFYSDDKVVLHGIVSSNYQENGLLFLEQFKKLVL